MLARKALRGGICLALTALACLATLPAAALIATDQGDVYEIPLPAFAPSGYGAIGALAQAEQALSERYAPGWRIHSWNPLTGTPHYAYGPKVPQAAGVASGAELDALARRVIAENGGILRANGDELRLAATPHAKGKWVAHYQQTYRGLDVWQGKALVAFSDAGELILLGSDCYDDIDLDCNPAINLAAAEMIAKASLPFDPATDGVEADGALLILPLPISPTEVSQHLVWRVRVHTESPLGTWVSHVDAHSGEIIWRYNDIHFGYEGDTDTGNEPVTYCDGEIREPVPYIDVIVIGAGATTSDGAGDWAIPVGSGAHTLRALFHGPYCNVVNRAGPPAIYSAQVQEGVPHTVRFDDGNSQQDERDVFDCVNEIHDWFQLLAPEFALPTSTMQAYVSIDENCNAYWNGTINFFTEGGGCANTGEIETVVQHEYGHGVQHSILGYQGDEGLGEGNADILAMLMTNESQLGRGFSLDVCETGIRDADNNLIYPDHVIGQEIHFAGQVIAGFHWDALVLLQQAYGYEAGNWMASDAWHYGRVLLLPTTQPDQVFATFFADDDDADLSNGTPNYGAYCFGAEHHGFACPEITSGVMMEHLTLDDIDDVGAVVPITVHATSTEGVIVDETVKVFWRHDGGVWHEVAMLPDPPVAGDYGATLPANNYGEVEYYFYAADDAGTEGTLPVGGPMRVFRYSVAQVADHAESVGGWISGAVGDTADDGFWVNVDPIGTVAQPEDDHTNFGTNCWVTGQHMPGEADDWGDVDGGRTTLFSGVYDLGGAVSAQLSFWFWLSSNLGENQGGDFLTVALSNDGGASYTGYATIGNSPNEWQRVVIDWANYFVEPGQIRVSWAAADMGIESLMEVAVDDLVILAEFSTGTQDDGLTVGFPTELAQNHPNPFNPVTEIRFSLAQAGPVSLKVYDAQGRLVRDLGGDLYEAGEHAVVWDGVDHRGNGVASGVYLYRLEAAGMRVGRRMVLIK